MAASNLRLWEIMAMISVLQTGHTLSAGAAWGADRVSRTLWLVPFWSTPDRVAVGLLSLHHHAYIDACASKHAKMLGTGYLLKSARRRETLPGTRGTGYRQRLSRIGMQAHGTSAQRAGYTEGAAWLSYKVKLCIHKGCPLLQLCR